MSKSGLWQVAILIGGCLLTPLNTWAQAGVATDYAGNQLYYVNAGGISEMGSVAPGVNPENLIFVLDQLIYYTLYGSGQVGVFNPYNRSNIIQVNGLDHPEALVLEPGCATILVTVQGLTTNQPSLARITIPQGSVTFVPLSFTPAGLAYDSNGDLFVADSANDTVHQVDPNAGTILNSLPSPLVSPNNQPDTPNEMIYDRFTRQLFITSSVYGGIYEIPTNLSGYTFMASVPAPAYGIISNGSGELFAASSNTYIYEYNIEQEKLTQLLSVPGLNGLAQVPGIGCAISLVSCKDK